MKEHYAQILAKHAASTITLTTGFITTRVEVLDQLTYPDKCALAVSIDIEGVSSGHDDISGCVVIGSQLHEESRPLLLAMVRHFGLQETLLDAPDGPTNILGEFLNIIIGLTGEEWAELGFDLNFSTPKDVSGQALLQSVAAAGAAFCIKVYVDDILMGDLLVYFN